jgi:hypothetical protein
VLAMVVAIIGVIVALFAAFWGVFVFLVPPIFTRKRMSYSRVLSTSLIHESAKSDKSLTVRYGKRFAKRLLKDPYIAYIRLSNIGRKDVRSSDFDQATPLQLDLGVKIVAILKVTWSLKNMPDLTFSVTDRRLNVGPSLIPHRARIDFILLVDGPCTAITPKSPLPEVSLKEEIAREGKNGLSLRQALGWLAVAFLVWWVIEAPAVAAHLIHNIGTFLSTAAKGISAFFASL